ncbi:exosome complex subunit Csl4 [Blastomyces gilchristii SLH14081]|uniref:Exosome complex subunit Csl4 n=1 Tax=Blastomyces gilchristii (strain SLH14081) TaxID=559298 RepID=A0A179UY53_BLAGS|nr:exosome complex subunit Csl4 [Blastomyces gilchristii SLH14081]OAT13025.1 exosome complex subunit Csl4 [Blastomyces gilchristii SLH14081]
MVISLPSIAVPGQRLGPASSFIPGPGTHIQDAFVCASIAGPVVLQKGGEEEESRQQLQKQQAQQQQQQRTLVMVARSFAQTLEGGAYGAMTGNNSNNSSKSGSSISRTPQAQKPPVNTSPLPTPTTKRPIKHKYNTLPAVGSIVLARVTRVQKRQATLSILVVLDDNPSSPYPTTTAVNDLPASLLSTTNADPLNADDLRFQALIRKEDVRAVEKDRVVMDEMFRVGDIVRAVVISLGDQSFYYCSTARNELGVVMGRSEEGNVLVPVSWREMVDGKSGRREARKVARPY